MSEHPDFAGTEPPEDWIKDPLRATNGQGHDAAPDPELLAALTVQAWCDLPLPAQRRLLGDVVTEAARVFLVGATGIGKTLFAYATPPRSPPASRSCTGPATAQCACSLSMARCQRA